MGPLFGVPLLLVEGDDDYRIWNEIPRHHITSFAVITLLKVKKFENIKKKSGKSIYMFARTRSTAGWFCPSRR